MEKYSFLALILIFFLLLFFKLFLSTNSFLFNYLAVFLPVFALINFEKFQKTDGIFLIFLLVFILEIFSSHFLGYFLIPLFLSYFFNKLFIKRNVSERNILNFLIKNAAIFSFFYLFVYFESYVEKFF